MKEMPFGRPILDEKETQAVAQVMASGVLTHGPKVKEFESVFAQFTGAEHALAVASCTAGLHLAYFYLGIKPGDEVIVPAETHVATAHAVELCGAKPVFVDVEKGTGNMDLKAVESLITPRTKAISVMHYLGRPIPMKPVQALAKKHKLFIVEDCALALGTTYEGVHMGLHGDVGCFSFYPVKHITTGEGGMLITKHKEIAQEISKQRAFGIDRHIVSERPIPGMYDVQGLGFNYRMNEMGAAMGVVQMKRLPKFLEKRRENFEALKAHLQSLEEVQVLQAEPMEQGRSSYYCLVAVLQEPLHEKRFEIMDHLKRKGIGTSIYYPRPVPHMSYYKAKYGYSKESFPEAARISGHSIALPIGPHLDKADMGAIADGLKDAIRQPSLR